MSCLLLQGVQGDSEMPGSQPRAVVCASCPQVQLSCSPFAAIVTGSAFAALFGSDNQMSGSNGCQGGEDWMRRKRRLQERKGRRGKGEQGRIGSAD